MSGLSRLFIAALLAISFQIAPAAAQAVAKGKQSEAHMFAERGTVAPGETLWLGLQIRLNPGWHTYWRTPGDAGLPTSIKWNLPPGFQVGTIQWPAPIRVAAAGLMTFAYEGEVTLLIPITVNGATGPATITADATWGACSEICIPEDGHFALPITVAANISALPGADAALIERARAKIPQAASFPVQAVRKGGDLVVSAGPGLPPGVTGATLFPEGDGAIENAAAQQVSVQGDALTLRVPVGASPPARLMGLLVLEGSQRVAYEITGDVAAAAGDADMTIWLAFVFALVGGLILNVMPCVLPVLVMKAFGMIAARESPSRMRRDALVYTAGVAAAFTALVAILLGLRAAGNSIGWGFQLQNPIVITVLANLMFVLGLSQSGVFTTGAGIAGLGQGLTRQGGSWGSFFTGVLAVVVAAPCTAPFMGPAIGYALTQSPVAAIAVFEGLALGLALPYLAIAFVPALARLLPKPGVWMERLKQILAFGLYGAAAWLVWVVSQQVSAEGLAFVFASLLAASFAAYSYGVAPNAPHRNAWLAAALVGVLLAGGTIASLRPRESEPAGAEAYTPEKLAELRALGKPVFVNFTAAWCISCLVNERIALSQPEVREAIRASGVVYLKADWTNRNPAITTALQALGREGVPVYVLYRPNMAPQLLPQVLTPGIVIEALSSVQTSAAGGTKGAVQTLPAAG